LRKKQFWKEMDRKKDFEADKISREIGEKRAIERWEKQRTTSKKK
jgi:hypothetical protein